MKRIKGWIDERVAASPQSTHAMSMTLSGCDSNSRATRMGRVCMYAGIVIESVEPVLTTVVVMMLACVSVFAQGSTGGTIFGQDQSMVPNAVRQTVIFAAGIAFLVGALTVIWGAFQYSQRQECIQCFVGGGLLMTIGGVISLISYLASGRGVTVDRTLN